MLIGFPSTTYNYFLCFVSFALFVVVLLYIEQCSDSQVLNAKKIIIKVQNKIKFNLLYDKNKILQKKIKLEQLRKETS